MLPGASPRRRSHDRPRAAHPEAHAHLLTETGQPPPRDYCDSFVQPGTARILPIDFARRVAVDPDSGGPSVEYRSPPFAALAQQRTASASGLGLGRAEEGLQGL